MDAKDQFCRDGIHMEGMPTNANEQVNFNSAEYFKSLEKWIQDVTVWQHFNFVSWQMFLMNQTAISYRPAGTSPQPVHVGNYNYPNYQAPTQIRGKEFGLCSGVLLVLANR